MIEAKVLSRSFTYNGVKLTDPDPKMTPEEVKTTYSHQYPESATAAITGREGTGETLHCSFVRAIGTKGKGQAAQDSDRKHKLISYHGLAERHWDITTQPSDRRRQRS